MGVVVMNPERRDGEGVALTIERWMKGESDDDVIDRKFVVAFRDPPSSQFSWADRAAADAGTGVGVAIEWCREREGSFLRKGVMTMKRFVQVLLVLASLGFLGSTPSWAWGGSSVAVGNGVGVALSNGGAVAVGTGIGVALSSGCGCCGCWGG